MTVNRTTLLDLPLPVTGTESGTWGDTTNNGLTQYLDIAIAGTLVLSTDADVTLTSTEGDSSATYIGATTAQYAILRWTATGSTTRNITALAQSKTYVVINATGGTQSIVLRGAGPTTGVTIISGEKAFCVWNGSDFVKVSSSAAAGGSNTQVQYNSSGVLAGSSNMTFNGTKLTVAGFLDSALTSGRVPYATTSGELIDSANLLYSGTDLTVYGITVGRGAGAVSTNTAVGASALAANTTGASNTAYGFNTLQANTTANDNTAIGFGAMFSNTTGASNTAVGSGVAGVEYGALANNTTGSFNTALGKSALKNNTTASNNTAVGYQAAYSNTTGTSVDAFGYRALYSNTTGTFNAAFGYQSLYSNSTGGSNTASGYAALLSNTTASNNAAFGFGTLYNNTTGASNTAVGSGALQSNTTASNNTAVGYQAGYSNTTGEYLTAVGRYALGSNTTGNYLTAIGSGSLGSNTTGTLNTSVGMNSLASNTTGANNVALGHDALNLNTTASNNTAVGYQAGYATTTGAGNTVAGYRAGYNNTTGVITAVGYQAGISNTTAGYNSAFGVNTLYNTSTGDYNTALGREALYSNTTASNNTAVGYQAGYSNTTGTANVFIGDGALYTNTTGNYNTAVGRNAGRANQTGQQLTVVGHGAGYNSTGGGNTFIGSGAGYSVTTGTKNTFIGGGDVFTIYPSGYFVTTGSGNTILGNYNGNQGGLDIRTANNHIVLSDGDGNPRILSDNQGNVGVGTIPSTGWNTSGRVLEWGNSTYHAATFQNGDDDLWFTSNAYFDGTNWKAYRTNTGSWLHLGFKGFYVQGADSVSAGANFTPVKILNVEKGQTLALEGGTQTSGVGIAFPGTQVASTNANTLDDYEQGSWTPVLYFAGVNSNSTYDDVYGSYTKIGNQVFCRFGIRLDVLGAGGSSSDGAQISGLPFTNYGASYADAVGQLGGNCFTSTESGMANIANGGTWFSIRSGSGVSDDIVKSDFGNGKFVFGSFFYNVE